MAKKEAKKEEQNELPEDATMDDAIAAAIVEETEALDPEEVEEELEEEEEPEELEEEIEEEEEPEELEEEEEPEELEEEVEEEEEPEDKSSDLQAPQSWDVENKLDWEKVPKHLQEQIIKRDTETATVLTESANARNFAQQFGQLMQPYAQAIQAAGAHPLSVIDETLSMRQGLVSGTNEQKATIVARIIKSFGVDVKAVDDMLVGKAQHVDMPNTRQAATQLDPATQARINNLEQQLTTQQQAQQDEINQQTQAFIDKTPFANELRNEMADIMDAAAARGEPVDLQKAYTLALSFHPELQQRINAKNNKKSMAKKKKAASSLKQKSKTPAPKKKKQNASVDDDIASSIESLMEQG